MYSTTSRLIAPEAAPCRQCASLGPLSREVFAPDSPVSSSPLWITGLLFNGLSGVWIVAVLWKASLPMKAVMRDATRSSGRSVATAIGQKRCHSRPKQASDVAQSIAGMQKSVYELKECEWLQKCVPPADIPSFNIAPNN